VPNPSQRVGLLDGVCLTIATALGAGLSPIAPGTAGTVMAIPVYYLLDRAALPAWAQLVVVAAVSVVSAATAQRVGRRFFHAADAGQIVIDEVAGYLVTVALLPFSWKTALLGFGLFRLFDITKPWPASYFDSKVHNGFGVTMDDLCAGLYGRLVLGLVLHYWP
jgi:phosphatidylglycerophosphatase A